MRYTLFGFMSRQAVDARTSLWGTGFFMLHTHRTRYLLFLLLVAGVSRNGLFAQMPPGRTAVLLDTTVALPRLTVTAARTEVPTISAPVRVSVLDAAQSKRSGTRSVAGLLEKRSGAFVRRYGGGGLSTPSIRGTSGSQTLVLLDGHRIVNPQLGQLDLSLLPIVMLESVEVMHGAGSALYGTDGIGGVVNLRSHVPEAGTRIVLSGASGAFGERIGELVISGGRNGLSGMLVAGYETATGDYLYLNKSLFPPQEVPRTGADRTSGSLLGSVRHREGRNRLQVSGWYNNVERGLPTIGGTRRRGERQWDEHVRIWSNYERRLVQGSLHIGGLVQQHALRYVNELAEIDATGDTRLIALEAEARTTRFPHWLLAAGVSTGLGNATHPNLIDDAKQSNIGLFLNSTGEVGRLLVFPALRVDTWLVSSETSRLSISPRLGLNYQPVAGLPVHLKASAGHAFREPTLNDRFWQPGGNPDLHPETGWSYDTGIVYASRFIEAEISGFGADIRDQITWLPTPSGMWSPVNTARVRSRGLESSLAIRGQLQANRPLEAGVFYTLVDSRDRSDPQAPAWNRQLRYVPRHQVKSFVQVGLGPFGLGGNAQYTGRRSVTTDGSSTLDPHLIFDLHLRLRLQRGEILKGSLALQVFNVFDKTYEVLKNHPMPPRSARVNLTLEFLR